MIRLPIVGLLLVTATSGCATTIHGTTQSIPISSSPPGAQVLIDDVPVGATPMVAKVSRRQAHVVLIVKDSATDRVLLHRYVSPWLLGDLVLYVAPIALDLSNGAAYNFPGDTLRARFGPTPAGIRRAPISSDLAAGAATVSAFVGLGWGPAMLGGSAKPYIVTQVLGLTGVITGFIVGYGGNDAVAYPLFYGGAGLYLGSRVWELANVMKQTRGKP